MSDATALQAAREHDARYADFAARLVSELAAEEADMARRNAVTLYVSATADTNAATMRPSK